MTSWHDDHPEEHLFATAGSSSVLTGLQMSPPPLHGCWLTDRAERRGAAHRHLGLQRADQLAELHAVIQLLHEELCSHLLACTTQDKIEELHYYYDSSDLSRFVDLNHTFSPNLSQPRVNTSFLY